MHDFKVTFIEGMKNNKEKTKKSSETKLLWWGNSEMETPFVSGKKLLVTGLEIRYIECIQKKVIEK